MEKKTRKKVVEENCYISFDGKEFSTEKECQDWESYVKKHKKTCPHCKGAKRFYKGVEKVFVEPEFRDLDDGTRSIYENCPTCKGKGYILS